MAHGQCSFPLILLKTQGRLIVSARDGVLLQFAEYWREVSS